MAVQHTARACGAVRRVPSPVPPAACAGALAPRRLRVPDPHSEGVVLFYNNRERWVIRNGHAT